MAVLKCHRARLVSSMFRVLGSCLVVLRRFTPDLVQILIDQVTFNITTESLN